MEEATSYNTTAADTIITKGEHNRKNTKPIAWPLTLELLGKFKPINKKALANRRLSLMDVDNASALTLEERIVVAVHLDNEEFVATGIILWMRCTPEKLRMDHRVLRALPYVDTLTVFANKDFFDQCRRWSVIRDEKVEGKELQYIMQYQTLCGRNMMEVDWHAEWNDSKPSAYIRSYPNSCVTGPWSTARYFTKFMHHAETIVEQVIAAAAQREDQSIDNWWARRALIVPTGSSSERKAAEDKLNKLQDAHEMERPNKKVVLSMAESSKLLEWIKEEPRMIVRCSTKHEPGLKNRPLHAADDKSTIIASYASAGMEQVMDQHGMDSRQTPQDLGRWMEAHYKHLTGVWVSTDYSRFFSEHHWWEQALVNTLMAKYWLLYGQETNKKSKAICALWTSRATTSRYTDRPYLRRHMHGLFSGQRDTARDNTLLHCIYSQITIDLLEELTGTRPLQTFYCGDDEDALMPTLIAATTYVELHKSIGWHLQDIKQIVGYSYHEYLRYMLSGDNTPIHPLSSMIAVLVTGNWYTADATWLCSQMQALTSQLWIILQRGAEHAFIERLAVILFNRMFTARTQSGKQIKLEWFNHRPGKDSHRLWNIAGNETDPAPLTAELPEPNKELKFPAVGELCTKLVAKYKITDTEALGRFSNGVRKEISASLYLNKKRELDAQMAILTYGKRKTVHKTIKIPKVNQNQPWLLDVLQAMQEVPKISQASGVLARKGIPMQLYQQLGGLKWLLEIDELALAGEILATEEPPKPPSKHFMYDFPGKFWGILTWM
jgi:hypothetical protein